MRSAAALLAGLLVVLAETCPADDKPAPGPARLEAFVIPGSKVKPANSDAPLAEGWPGGTEPGVIEVKTYPGYRSAIARGKGAGYGSGSVLFFPLFKHITGSDIAMTSPVLSGYSPGLVEEPKGTGEVTMEFVYRSATMGQVGQGVGAVKVEDHPAASYACLGVQGDVDAGRMRKATEALRAWLKAHEGEWVEDGPPRRLGYHGPMTRREERLFEVQIPVKPGPRPPAEARPRADGTGKSGTTGLDMMIGG